MLHDFVFVLLSVDFTLLLWIAARTLTILLFLFDIPFCCHGLLVLFLKRILKSIKAIVCVLSNCIDLSNAY